MSADSLYMLTPRFGRAPIAVCETDEGVSFDLSNVTESQKTFLRLAEDLNEPEFSGYLQDLFTGNFESDNYKKIMEFMIESRNEILEELNEEGHSGGSWGIARNAYGYDQLEKLLASNKAGEHSHQLLFMFGCKIAVLDAFCQFEDVCTIELDMENPEEWNKCSEKTYQKTIADGKVLTITEQLKQSCLKSCMFLNETHIESESTGSEAVTISYLNSVDGYSYSDNGWIRLSGSQGKIPLQMAVSSGQKRWTVLESPLSEDFGIGSFDEMKLKASRAFNNKIFQVFYEFDSSTNPSNLSSKHRTISLFTPSKNSLSELYGYNTTAKINQILDTFFELAVDFETVKQAVSSMFYSNMRMASQFQKLVEAVKEKEKRRASCIDLQKFISRRLSAYIINEDSFGFDVSEEELIKSVMPIQGLLIDFYLRLLNDGSISINSIEIFPRIDSVNIRSFCDYCLNVAVIIFSMQLSKRHLDIDRVLTEYSSKTFVGLDVEPQLKDQPITEVVELVEEPVTEHADKTSCSSQEYAEVQQSEACDVLEETISEDSESVDVDCGSTSTELLEEVSDDVEADVPPQEPQEPQQVQDKYVLHRVIKDKQGYPVADKEGNFYASEKVNIEDVVVGDIIFYKTSDGDGFINGHPNEVTRAGVMCLQKIHRVEIGGGLYFGTVMHRPRTSDEAITKDKAEEIWNSLTFTAEELNGKTSSELNQLTRYAFAQAVERYSLNH